MRKLRKGDEVIVIAGRDRRKVGEVVKVLIESDQVLVAGINIAKKHVKPDPMKNQLGGIVDKNMPIHISNVAIYNPETKKADRVGFKEVEGKKVRIFKSNQKELG